MAVPSADTIIEVEGDFISNIPDRSRLRRGQTPQAFDIRVIRTAYELALKDPAFRTTDDCGVVRRYMPQTPIYVVRGEESNMKLTYKEDTYMMDKLFQLKNTEVGTAMPDARFFEGKVAVVFGGSYGIGSDIVRMLGERGARVFAFSRSMGGVDIGDRQCVDSTLKRVADEAGRIDFVISTAGILNKEPLAAMDYSVIESAVRTNYMGTVNVAVGAYPYLRQSGGHLIFFTSSSYTRGRAFYSIYSSTKAAIVNFVQAVAQEWEGDGIKINCINPERTKTPMRVSNFGTEPDDTLLKPEKVAEATLRTLASDYTGQVVDVRRAATDNR